MGTRGPVPKRSDVRRRRNKESEPDRAEAGEQIKAPPLKGAKELHPLAVAWYRSLSQSGQAQFYEASDWMTAQLIARAISEFCEKPSAMMLSSLLSGASNLLATEGDRRRMRLELERAAEDDGDASVTAIADYKRALGVS